VYGTNLLGKYVTSLSPSNAPPTECKEYQMKILGNLIQMHTVAHYFEYPSCLHQLGLPKDLFRYSPQGCLFPFPLHVCSVPSNKYKLFFRVKFQADILLLKS